MVVSEMDLHASLKKYFGFSKFKGLQQEVIKNIVQGKNTFVIMPTGGGKSLCYQLPALLRPGLTVVISPLIVASCIEDHRSLEIPGFHSLQITGEKSG